MKVSYLRSKHLSIKIMLTVGFTLLVMFSPFDSSGLLLTYCESTEGALPTIMEFDNLHLTENLSSAVKSIKGSSGIYCI